MQQICFLTFLNNNMYYFLVRGASIVKVTCELWLPVSSPGRLRTQCRCVSSPSLHTSHQWSPRHIGACVCLVVFPGRHLLIRQAEEKHLQFFCSIGRRCCSVPSGGALPTSVPLLFFRKRLSTVPCCVCEEVAVHSFLRLSGVEPCAAGPLASVHLEWRGSYAHRKTWKWCQRLEKGKGAAAGCFLVFTGTFEEVDGVEGKGWCEGEAGEWTEGGRSQEGLMVWTEKKERNRTSAGIAIYCKGKKMNEWMTELIN